jgi:ribonuclease T1
MLGRNIAAAMLTAALVVGANVPANARTTADMLPVVALTDLPAQAREVHGRIVRGETFQSERDGAVFGNREKLLPAEPRGYYHEYTVPTPGTTNRGARRIVCGGPRKSPVACWYTDDHYQTFRRIRG